ncbi:hypothetical protein Pla110_44530 [Polystyrenella longa]|uniref:DUF3560 domain-containing protein n=1 Tax=Polystyrenella longa TaxID=2528007 RepID=A0A518CTZ1_9PLAN|nr:DUF3560 domain-containing protein [Polystyrenella longa]QDU82692.1 hypothetical protein Pla110_44530 [Polystyrenella longa]
MNNYEERKQRRIDRLNERAEKKKQDSINSWDRAHDLASVIPFGQPIHIGHHSEKRDRAHRKRIEQASRKGYELSKEADELQRRADAAKGNHAISSQDPEAVQKLRQKLAKCESDQETWKLWNRLYRKHKGDLAKLEAELTAEEFDQIVKRVAFRKHHWPGVEVKKPVESYELSNNNAEIKRLKERIAKLEKRAERTARPPRFIGDIEILDNLEYHKVEVHFAGKPREEIRSFLKSRGFRWTPSAEAWTRTIDSRTEWAIEGLRELVGKNISD